MKMYMQWIKDNGYTSSSRTLSILCPTRIEKLALSQFQLYIETGKTTQCFVCRNCKKTIFIRAAEVKEKFFYLTHVKDP